VSIWRLDIHYDSFWKKVQSSHMNKITLWILALNVLDNLVSTFEIWSRSIIKFITYGHLTIFATSIIVHYTYVRSQIDLSWTNEANTHFWIVIVVLLAYTNDNSEVFYKSHNSHVLFGCKIWKKVASWRLDSHYDSFWKIVQSSQDEWDDHYEFQCCKFGGALVSTFEIWSKLI